MSLHYLLDGYNILKKMDVLANLPLEEGRRAFLKWLDSTRPQGSVNNQVIVVFDGNPDNFGGMQAEGSDDIKVIFSQRGSADDEIKRMVEEDHDCKNCVVVTDDKEIYVYARRLGARIMSVAEFTKGIRVSGSQGKSIPKTADGKYISLTHQEKINQEFRKIWLGEKQ